MNGTDVIIQAVTPTVMVPKFGQFEPMVRPGHRFLATGDGLWLEVRRSWMYARLPLAMQFRVAMPYGLVEPEVSFQCGPIPVDVIQQFSSLARRECPTEAAGWVVWNENTRAFSFRELHVISASPGHICYHRPMLADGEHLVVDWHSHGTGKAFFSRTDNKDDKGEVKMAAVLGHCDKDRVDMAFRLCLLGMYVELHSLVIGAEVEFTARAPERESL